MGGGGGYNYYFRSHSCCYSDANEMLWVQFRNLKQLRVEFAGRHGPVKDKYIYDVMCRSDGYCIAQLF